MAQDLKACVEELESQPRSLREFAKRDLPRAASGSVFVGAGDSYSAAMAGFFGSHGSCIAVDPYHLASDPKVADGVDVFLISVSGRTVSNLAAARSVRRLARRTVAITADERSRLAGLVDQVVRLPMAYVPRTPGLLSYTLSLLAVLKIAGRRDRCDFEAAYRAAGKDEGRVSWGDGTTYFLGNALAYPAALYAAAKTYEFLGMKAHPELLEEFSHLELFSLTLADRLNIFCAFDPDGASGRLSRAIARGGYGVSVVPSGGRSEMERLFHAVFVAQRSVLRRAGELGLKRPGFLASRARLAASDSMIY